MKPYKMKAGSLPCMKNYISLLEIMYGPLFPDLLITMSLAPSGSLACRHDGDDEDLEILSDVLHKFLLEQCRSEFTSI